MGSGNRKGKGKKKGKGKGRREGAGDINERASEREPMHFPTKWWAQGVLAN